MISASPSTPHDTEEARDRLRRARRVLALTGAGISAESGVPTFRGPQGLWRDFRPEDLATPQAFSRDPLLVWEWYESRRERMGSVQPNAGHHALARLEERVPEFLLATQNVDGLHALAGSRSLVELHGCLWRVRCTGCGAVREERKPFAALPAEVVLVVGTSSLVYPAAAVPEAALEAGAFVVEVNPERTPLSAACSVSLRGRAAEVLPLLVGGGA
jgi:NAD-dependent deacetylase